MNKNCDKIIGHACGCGAWHKSANEFDKTLEDFAVDLADCSQGSYEKLLEAFTRVRNQTIDECAKVSDTYYENRYDFEGKCLVAGQSIALAFRALKESKS